MLTLPLPPSANRYWRSYARKGKGGGFHAQVVRSPEADAYKFEVMSVVDRSPTSEPVSITMRVYNKNKTRDLDNNIKVLLDALKGLLYDDDVQVVEIHAYKDIDHANPRVELWCEVIDAA